MGGNEWPVIDRSCEMAMETYSFQMMDELCGRVEETLKGLPSPEPSSREEPKSQSGRCKRGY